MRTRMTTLGVDIEGIHVVRPDDSDTVAAIEIRFWPGRDGATVPAPKFASIVGDALRASLAAIIDVPARGSRTVILHPEGFRGGRAKTGREVPDQQGSPPAGSAPSDAATVTHLAESEPEDNPHVLPTAARRRRGSPRPQTDV